MATKVTPEYVRQEVLVGQARMFLQKLTATSVPALPDEAVALNGDWPTDPDNTWVPVGATEEGLNFRFTRDTEDITIEEQTTPVFVVTTGTDMSADVVLSQDTVETMLIAYGGGEIVVTAPGVAIHGKSVLTVGDEMDSYALGFEAANSFDFPRRVLIPEVLSVGQAETMYRRAANARRYSTSFRVISSPSEVEIVEITAAPTG